MAAWESGVFLEQVRRHLVHFSVQFRSVHPHAKQRGAVNVAHGKPFPDFVPEFGWPFVAAVVMAKEDSAGLDDRKTLRHFINHPRLPIAGIAKDNSGRS